MADSVSKQMENILSAYSKEVSEVADKETKASSKDCANELRNVSAKKTGEYARGWLSFCTDREKQGHKLSGIGQTWPEITIYTHTIRALRTGHLLSGNGSRGCMSTSFTASRRNDSFSTKRKRQTRSSGSKDIVSTLKEHSHRVRFVSRCGKRRLYLAFMES